ncbi:MAG: DUF3263 domain-containing protein [Frankiales bacterium]|nr:DUF3263 domain-containing protein [Frankiales bacterium]
MNESLTDGEKAMLAFEKAPWRYAGMKEQAIRDLFGISATAYYQQLNALIDKPDALRTEPVLVKRLLRLRETRRASRAMPPASTTSN